MASYAYDTVWIFVGDRANLPSGVFISKEIADEWIKKYKLSGILTEYPVNIGIYDWAIQNKYFIPKNELQQESRFIERFSSASLQHYHYENGAIRC